MSEVKAKIIKKVVQSSDESGFAIADKGSSLIEGEVYEASQVARDLLQKARSQAEEILQKAHSERDSMFQNARDQGYQEGLAAATEWIVKAKEFQRKTAESGKNDLKILAVKIAEKIVGKGLELAPELINDIVSQAIRTLRQQKNVTVRCNEEDYETLKQSEKEFLEVMAQHGSIEIVTDSKVSRGGCIVESEIGVVDARLETQLKKLQTILTSK